MSCSSLSCESPPCWSNKTCDPINVDPDVAGIGVLVGYFASATIALFVLVLAYFSDSIPRDYLNIVDQSIILRATGEPKLPIWSGKQNQIKRVELFSGFILSLSDQQLMTGLALLISCFILRCSISAVTFDIVTNLAWFSFTVHLVCFMTLGKHFSKYQKSFLCRVFLITVAYIMLFVVVIQRARICASKRFPGLPAQCLFDGEPSNLASFLEVSFHLLLGQNLVATINGFSRRTSLSPSFLWKSMAVWIPSHRRAMKHDDMFEKLYMLAASDLRNEMFEDCKKGTARWCRLRADAFFDDALLSFFPSVIGFYLYGLATSIESVWLYPLMRLNDNTEPTSFGQLLPLLLLGLPCLAVLEILSQLEVTDHSVKNSSTGRNKSKANAVIQNDAADRQTIIDHNEPAIERQSAQALVSPVPGTSTTMLRNPERFFSTVNVSLETDHSSIDIAEDIREETISFHSNLAQEDLDEKFLASLDLIQGWCAMECAIMLKKDFFATIEPQDGISTSQKRRLLDLLDRRLFLQKVVWTQQRWYFYLGLGHDSIVITMFSLTPLMPKTYSTGIFWFCCADLSIRFILFNVFRSIVGTIYQFRKMDQLRGLVNARHMTARELHDSSRRNSDHTASPRTSGSRTSTRRSADTTSISRLDASSSSTGAEAFQKDDVQVVSRKSTASRMV